MYGRFGQRQFALLAATFKRRKGRVALQIHTGKVWIENEKRRLPPPLGKEPMEAR
jgi:hypothetical protein